MISYYYINILSSIFIDYISLLFGTLALTKVFDLVPNCFFAEEALTKLFCSLKPFLAFLVIDLR